MLATEVQKLETENRILKESLEIAERKLGSQQRPKDCGNCIYYIQHYVKSGSQFVPTYCGHCIHGNLKKRKTDDSCKYFESGNYSKKKLA